MTAGTDWVAWHDGYDDPSGPLAWRLAVVQECIGRVLDDRPEGRIDVISICAGRGLDLLGTLATHDAAPRVRARLVELDPALAADARRRAAAIGAGRVEVVEGDAALLTAYAGAAPADLVLVCGVFGNIADEDIRTTIGALPRLCRVGATVIWTRHRRPPDLTPAIRDWFAAASFSEVAFHAHCDHSVSVGAHRYEGAVMPAAPNGRLFTFVGSGNCRADANVG